MRKTLWLISCVAFVAAAVLASAVRSAHGLPQLRKEFVAKYVKSDASEAKDKGFAEAVENAQCNVCHAGEEKKNRNAYGQALAKFLVKADRNNKDKIRQSLDKAAGVKAKPDDPNAPTFGDCINQGKLPCDEAK